MNKVESLQCCRNPVISSGLIQIHKGFLDVKQKEVVINKRSFS